MRQAIETRYLGPTNFRGSRVVASAQAGSMTVPWDHALDVADNHAAAARALADKYGWLDRCVMHGGGNAKGDGFVFVLVPREVA